MCGSGFWKTLPARMLLVPTGEAVTTVQALTTQPLVAVTTARPSAAVTSVSVSHFGRPESCMLEIADVGTSNWKKVTNEK